MKEYAAVIQAGGKGTRMESLTKGVIPKPLLLLNGKPMIQWQIENLSKYGITHFVIIVGYLGEEIVQYFGNGEKLGVHIEYINENPQIPLGSAGSLFYLADKLSKDEGVLLIFGDVMFDIDLSRFTSFHETKSAIITLLVHPNSHPYDSDLVKIDNSQRLLGFDSKNGIRDYDYDNLVNAGMYILDRKVLDILTEETFFDLEKDVISYFINTDRVFCYSTPEYVKDAGTPERFYLACKEQQDGVWEKKNLSNKQKCIFLDRDGTINIYKGLIYKGDDLELEEGVADAIKYFNSTEYLLICVTNQPVIARGLCTIEDVEGIHRRLSTILGKSGAYLNDVIYCPHHPDKGYPEENPKYKIACSCRKPNIGMIEMMQRKYNIDLSKSYIVGDTTVDIKTGKNAGLRTVLVKTGMSGEDGTYDVEPDFVIERLIDLIESV